MGNVYKNKKSLIFVGSIILLIIVSIISIFTYNTFAASSVLYEIQNDWKDGAIVNVTVNNETSTEMDNWKITWTFPDNQTIKNMWGATYTQNDSKVTVNNVAWNSKISAGSSVNFGFILNYTNNNSIPSDITLNDDSQTTNATATTPNTTDTDNPTESATNSSTATKTPSEETTSEPTESSTSEPETPSVDCPTDLSILPDLSGEPTVVELKAWVSKTYDLFPQFKQLYEEDLAMTKDEAMAFHFADMSRESGKDGYWQMNLETGIGSAGHAWGPFQAAVTNFIGGGYDADILNSLDMPTPDISQFKVPNVSTYAGMKRLAEGIEKSKTTLGTNRTTVEYLLGTLAHHNTGHATFETITNGGWLQSYGNEVLRMMQGYLIQNHLTDSKAFWTTEPIDGVNGPWSGGNK